MLQKFNDAESAFLDEVHSKKKETANYRTATKGKRLGKNNVMFASDFMSRKEKMEYRRAGKVMTTNLYDNILAIAEFEALEVHEQKNRLQYWRTNNSIKEIQEGMGISHKKFYDIIERLELPKGMRGGRRTGAGSKKTASTKAPAKKQEQAPAVVEQQPAAAEPVQRIIVNGLHLAFHGTYTAEQIIKQLSKFELLLDGEQDEFYIELNLMQKQPKK